MQMKANQEVKMRADKEKMQKIDKMIEMKKSEKQMGELKEENARTRIASHGSSAKDIVTRKERQLAEQALEIKKQTSLLLKMQQNMLTEKRKTEEEKRQLKDQRQIMELQQSVRNLQRVMTQKQGSGSLQNEVRSSASRSVKDRVGFKKVVVGDFDCRLDV